MTFRSFVLFLVISWSYFSACTTSQELGKVDVALRQYSFYDLDSLQKVEARPLAIFLHTDWCQYCANMKQTTLRNREVIKLLNEQYYFISFDAESETSINFHGQTFKHQPTGRNTGTHELAQALGTVDGSLTYPTFVLLNTKDEIIFQHNAFLDAPSMRTILERGQIL